MQRLSQEEPVTCHDYIAQHAGPLAQAVRHFLAREIPITSWKT